jgi:hypothetical protein
VAVVVVNNGRLFLGRAEIFKFGFRRCDDETLEDRRTPLSLFARLLALLAILAHGVVHQVVTSPTAIQVGTQVGPVVSRDVLATRAEGDAQLAHAMGWTKERNWLIFRSCASFYGCQTVSNIKKEQEVCCFEGENNLQTMCVEECDCVEQRRKQTGKKERKKDSLRKKERKKARKRKKERKQEKKKKEERKKERKKENKKKEERKKRNDGGTTNCVHPNRGILTVGLI